MVEAALERRIDAIRRFNRFYTQRVGVLDERLLQSPLSLTEVRVLYELAHREAPTAAEICEALALDAGYLSRILGRFRARRFLVGRRSTEDGRETLLSLSEKGRKIFAALDARARDSVAALLQNIAPTDQARLVDAMGAIERLLGGAASASAGYVLRPHRAGDMGWVVHRHGVLYAHEYGWDERFEALVARIVGDFIDHYDARRERCWIAELDGEPVGSVFLVRGTDDTAKLRLLLVEPRARGMGIGEGLVGECIRFARGAGYRTVTLWTNDVLAAARRIYQRAGFRLVGEDRHRSFGPELTAQTWELDLGDPSVLQCSGA